jgi:AP-2 complex subunit mu-1
MPAKRHRPRAAPDARARAAAVQLVVLFTQYFAKVKDKYVRENFVLIYELLDEVCDNGVPQITDPSVLKAYIFQKGTVVKEKRGEAASDVTLQARAAPPRKRY